MAGNVHSTGYDHPWSCTQCGICAAVCPTGAIRQPPGRHGYVYPVVDPEKCNDCGLCVQCCPGPRVVEQEERFPSPAEERRLYGPFETAFLAHASDEQLRWRGSSGGVVTALLVHLLQSGAIKGAIVTDAGGERCLPRTFVAATEEEILGASGSKYCLTSIGQAVRELADMPDGQYAAVGLPCQMQGLWRAEQQFKWLREKIGLRIALFCAGTRDTRYRSALVARMGLREEDLAEFSFRGDGWPGSISARSAAGSAVRLESADKWVRQQFDISARIPPRCLLCDDPLGAFADIAVGDPWKLGARATMRGSHWPSSGPRGARKRSQEPSSPGPYPPRASLARAKWPSVKKASSGADTTLGAASSLRPCWVGRGKT